MNIDVKVWTLAWDTREGTDCQIFASKREFLEFFKNRILAETTHLDSAFAKQIERLFDAGEVGDAYALWQDSYKAELDTYNWDVQQVKMELLPAHS